MSKWPLKKPFIDSKKKDIYITKYVLPLVNIADGITWSGLPLLLAKETNNTENMYLLMLTSLIASAIFTLVGGYFADIKNRKNLILCVFLIDAILTFTLGIQGTADNLSLFYIVSFVNALGASLALSSLSVWTKDILSTDKEIPLSRGLAQRGFISILAKATGFILGPFIFLSFGFKALYIDALFSIIFMLILSFVDFENKVIIKTKNGILNGYYELLDKEFWTEERLMIFKIYAITSIFTVPTAVITYSFLVDKFGANSINATFFWTMASLGSLLTHLGLSRKISDRLLSRKKIIYSYIGFILSFLIIYFSPSPTVLIIGFMFFTLSNPLLSNALDTEVYNQCEEAFRGRFNALCIFADDLIGGIILILCMLALKNNLLSIYYVICIPIIVLSLIYTKKSSFFLKNKSLTKDKVSS